MEKGLVGGKYLFTDSTHLKASANKNKKHNEKREVRVSQYIDMLNQDVAKVRYYFRYFCHGREYQ